MEAWVFIFYLCLLKDEVNGLPLPFIYHDVLFLYGPSSNLPVSNGLELPEHSSPKILFLVNYFSYFAVKSKMTSRFLAWLIERYLILIYQSWSLDVVEYISGEVKVFTTSTKTGRASQHVRQFAFFLQSSVSNVPPDHSNYTTTHLSISFFAFPNKFVWGHKGLSSPCLDPKSGT